MYKRTPKGWLKHKDFILLDLICLAVSYVLAHLLRHGNISIIFSSRIYTNVWLALSAFDLLIMLLAESMHNVLKRGFFKEFTTTMRQDALLFGTVTIFLFTIKDELVSRAVLWTTIGLHFVISYLTRIIWKKRLGQRRSSNALQSMLLIVDWGKVEATLDRFGTNASDGFRVTGIVVADKDLAGSAIRDIPVVCSLEDAPKYICRKWIDEVFISTAELPAELIKRCAEMGVTTHRVLDTDGSDRQFVEKIAGTYVVTNTINTMSSMQVFVKRVMDIVGGIFGSLAALIVMLIVGPIIKKESPGPILFKQERIGRNGRRFKMYNLRSMQTLVN